MQLPCMDDLNRQRSKALHSPRRVTQPTIQTAKQATATESWHTPSHSLDLGVEFANNQGYYFDAISATYSLPAGMISLPCLPIA